MFPLCLKSKKPSQHSTWPCLPTLLPGPVPRAPSLCHAPLLGKPRDEAQTPRVPCEASQVAHCDAPPGSVSSLPGGPLTMPSQVAHCDAAPGSVSSLPRRAPNHALPGPCLACPGRPFSKLCRAHSARYGSCTLGHSAVPGLLRGCSGAGWKAGLFTASRTPSGLWPRLTFVSPSVPGRPGRDELFIMDAWSFRGRWRTKPLAETAFPWLLSGFSRAASFQGLASCLADCLLPAPLPLLALHKIMQG